MKQKPWIIYDSGIGGITVLSHLIKHTANPILYFADTAFFPYGTKPPHVIQERAFHCLSYLATWQPKKILFACHTLSTALFKNTPSTVQEMVETTVLHTLHLNKTKSSQADTIGLLATPATLRSGIYQKAFSQLAPHLHVIGMESPSLASLIETGEEQGSIAQVAELTRALTPLKQQQIHLVVLACTHYPLLLHTLQTTFPTTHFFDPSHSFVQSVVRKKVANATCLHPVRFLISGSQELFAKQLNAIWKEPYTLQTVDIPIEYPQRRRGDAI